MRSRIGIAARPPALTIESRIVALKFGSFPVELRCEGVDRLRAMSRGHISQHVGPRRGARSRRSPCASDWEQHAGDRLVARVPHRVEDHRAHPRIGLGREAPDEALRRGRRDGAGRAIADDAERHRGRLTNTGSDRHAHRGDEVDARRVVAGEIPERAAEAVARRAGRSSCCAMSCERGGARRRRAAKPGSASNEARTARACSVLGRPSEPQTGPPPRPSGPCRREPGSPA